MQTVGFEVASYCLEVAFLCMRASTSKIQSPLSDCHKQTRFRSARVGPTRMHSGRQAVLAHKMPQRISAFLRFDAYGASATASFYQRSSARLRGGMCRALSDLRRSSPGLDRSLCPGNLASPADLSCHATADACSKDVTWQTYPSRSFGSKTKRLAAALPPRECQHDCMDSEGVDTVLSESRPRAAHEAPSTMYVPSSCLLCHRICVDSY